MFTNHIEAGLEGKTSVNLREVAHQYFTPQFFKEAAGALLNAAGMAGNLGIPVSYHPTELDKCVIHYCSRELIGELWGSSMPTLKPLVGADGRFDLDKALTGTGESLSANLKDNLDFGQRFILDTTYDLYAAWVRDLGRRSKANPDELMPIMFTIYRAHSILIAGGDWSLPTIMDTTFTSAGRENFDWVRDYPNMTRVELEEIVANSHAESTELANQLGIKSAVKEKVVRDAALRGGLAYVLDPQRRLIIFNPELNEEVEKEEESLAPEYYDQTKLVLRCPAKFVPSTLYSTGNMLNDLVRFRASAFVEIYLATHDRR